jgi:HSP20 family protein
MRDINGLVPAAEPGGLADEFARLFDELDRASGRSHRPAAGTCTPPLDVIETAGTIEIVLDLPGIAAADLRILIRNGVVMVAGEKRPADAADRAEGHFLLVERGFGRLARAVQVTAAFDGSRAHAVLQGGELRIVLPRIPERRGREIRVSIQDGPH